MNLNVAGDCSASRVDLWVIVPVTIDDTGEFSVATIWDKGLLLAHGSQRAGILEGVEEMCKAFVVDWNSVNRH